MLIIASYFIFCTWTCLNIWVDSLAHDLLKSSADSIFISEGWQDLKVLEISKTLKVFHVMILPLELEFCKSFLELV